MGRCQVAVFPIFPFSAHLSEPYKLNIFTESLESSSNNKAIRQMSIEPEACHVFTAVLFVCTHMHKHTNIHSRLSCLENIYAATVKLSHILQLRGTE